jgi:hypothetical protein
MGVGVLQQDNLARMGVWVLEFYIGLYGCWSLTSYRKNLISYGKKLTLLVFYRVRKLTLL